MKSNDLICAPNGHAVSHIFDLCSKWPRRGVAPRIPRRSKTIVLRTLYIYWYNTFLYRLFYFFYYYVLHITIFCIYLCMVK